MKIGDVVRIKEVNKDTPWYKEGSYRIIKRHKYSVALFPNPWEGTGSDEWIDIGHLEKIMSNFEEFYNSYY